MLTKLNENSCGPWSIAQQEKRLIPILNIFATLDYNKERSCVMKLDDHKFSHTTYFALSSEAGKPSFESSSHIHLSTEVAMLFLLNLKPNPHLSPDN